MLLKERWLPKAWNPADFLSSLFSLFMLEAGGLPKKPALKRFNRPSGGSRMAFHKDEND
jgi:hypothetical protein